MMKLGEIPLIALILVVPWAILHWLGMPNPYAFVAGICSAFVWYLVGCLVLCSLDENGSLFEWAKQCPLGYTWVPMLWPAILGLLWWERRVR